MATGYLRGSVCYSTNAEAADAHFLGSGPFYTSGSTSYLSWFEKVSGVWQIKRQSISSTGVVNNLTASTATVPTFPTCDTTAEFTDGLAVGWGIAGLMIAAWGYSKVRQAAR